MSLSHHPILCVAAATALAATLAAPARADRPSLIELQATLEQLVDGLCGGDPASCGAAPPPGAAVGSLLFDPGGPNEISLSLVDLTVVVDKPVSCGASCVPAGNASFANIEATVVQNASSALLATSVINGTMTSADVSLPSESKALHFDGVILKSLDSADVPGRTKLTFAYNRIIFDWQGTLSQWNLQTATGSGCSAPNGEKHLELNGNATSNLVTGEIASVHQLGLLSVGPTYPTIALTRTPPHACALRAAASGQIFDATYDRLWSSNDAFSGRQSIETIEAASVFFDRWELRIESGVVSEHSDLIPDGGLLTTRDFSPVDGSQTASHAAPF